MTGPDGAGPDGAGPDGSAASDAPRSGRAPEPPTPDATTTPAADAQDSADAGRRLRHDLDAHSAAAGDGLARAVRDVDPTRRDDASGGEDATAPEG
ncbi:hypothetical protein [uncultured Jatrophihabitans sp.]|uniref:hypothetical protein n=1 Tax=uncultured Jatrophihabitans sp. TaxID=1610747 RepID=UPI0035C947F6